MTILNRMSENVMARSVENIKCSFEWEALCEHLIVAYHENKDAVRDLRGYENKYDKDRLQQIDCDINRPLKETVDKSSELLELLYLILCREVSALLQLRVSCNAMNRELMTIRCEDALYFTTLITYELLLVITDVAEVSQLEAIKKVEANLEKDFYDETSGETLSELANTLGMELLRLLDPEP
ncbi:unnamed protein product [Nippostrongylus brasiliensis]|uniref:Uncharacterized protein n=1 Tax=Nippostrongylus brasiliensis TaxID=27835 RepID=A0A0N4YAA7_NIPBR|nr:unnamed protein product [Nippostrongylus brasiliensis]